MIHSKQHRGCRIQVPGDLWLPAVENSRRFTQRGHSARYAPERENALQKRHQEPRVEQKWAHKTTAIDTNSTKHKSKKIRSRLPKGKGCKLKSTVATRDKLVCRPAHSSMMVRVVRSIAAGDYDRDRCQGNEGKVLLVHRPGAHCRVAAATKHPAAITGAWACRLYSPPPTHTLLPLYPAPPMSSPPPQGTRFPPTPGGTVTK